VDDTSLEVLVYTMTVVSITSVGTVAMHEQISETKELPKDWRSGNNLAASESGRTTWQCNLSNLHISFASAFLLRVGVSGAYCVGVRKQGRARVGNHNGTTK
jgi:hypothetical protein